MINYKLKTLKVGFLKTNCYIFQDNDTGNAMVIDPGDNGIYIKSILRDMDARCRLILLTHGHFDHILALGDIRRDNTIVAIHKKDADSLTARDLFSPMLDHDPRPFAPADFLFDADGVYNLAGFEFNVMNTPGHTPGSVCYIFDDLMFSGDTLFNGGVGRTDFKGGSDDDMKRSLERLYRLPGDFALYPGHDESSVLSDEKKYNLYFEQFRHK
ncbi:MAG: hypothetical protein A2Y17_03130 [Clostridiales bacterium GWF2_38_85]|nr:MAG: hypothetical protein A2Y17_03130 [Clostridiales bacterium GWF2_38_85]